MTGSRTTSIDVRGPFSLEEVAMMSFGHRDEHAFDGVLRLAFCTDADLEHQVGVEVRQPVSQRLELTVLDGSGASADLGGVTRQVARIVSADHDGAEFDRICRADPVLARVHAVAPGFRPALFHSAYDACVWSVLSARRRRSQAIGLRARLSQAHGAAFDLAGQTLHALPSPRTLVSLDQVPGLQQTAVPRLHAVARAAIEGSLDVDRLVGLSVDDALADLQRLPGIGPFYASLVVIRACGLTDVLSTLEPHGRAAVRDHYGLDHLPDDAELVEIADGWRPFRTWVAVMLRALGERSADPSHDGVGR